MLLRKPGAFRRYRFRDDLFPTETFRKAYERLNAAMSERSADLEYLRILELAATTMECAVEQALICDMKASALPKADTVRDRVSEAPQVPEIDSAVVDLGSYDRLLESTVEVLA